MLSGIGPTTTPFTLWAFLLLLPWLVTASYYHHTYAGSVIRTLPAVPVDTTHKISILYFFTSSLSCLYANLSSAPGYPFYFQPLIQKVRCGPTVGTLPSSYAPPSSIPQERVRSTTTFHNPQFKNRRVGDTYEITEQELFVTLIWQDVQAVNKNFRYWFPNCPKQCGKCQHVFKRTFDTWIKFRH